MEGGAGAEAAGDLAGAGAEAADELSGAGAEAAPLVRLRQLGPQWVAASGGAFAGLAQSPERYAAASRLVAAWLRRLRAAGDSGAGGGSGGGELDVDVDEERDRGAEAAAAVLVDAWDARESGTGDAVADGPALPLTAAERAALTAAAFAIRHGEVMGWLTARRRRRAMARAVRAAQVASAASAAPDAGPPGAWLVLDEAGDPAGDPFVAYRRLEVDPFTGSGVLVETQPDESLTGVVHAVQVVTVDPVSGELTADNNGAYWEFGSAEEREGQVSALRSESTRRHGGPAG